MFALPQVVEPGVRELDGRGGVGFVLVVRRIEIGATDWAVEAEVVNATPVRWLVSRPHFGGAKFGIYVAPSPDDLRPASLEAQRRTTPPLLATRFEPPLPGVLEPHARWSGRFAGPGRIPRDSYLSVAFGRFTTYEPPPKGLPDRLLALTTTRVRVGRSTAGS